MYLTFIIFFFLFVPLFDICFLFSLTLITLSIFETIFLPEGITDQIYISDNDYSELYSKYQLAYLFLLYFIDIFLTLAIINSSSLSYKIFLLTKKWDIQGSIFQEVWPSIQSNVFYLYLKCYSNFRYSFVLGRQIQISFSSYYILSSCYLSSKIWFWYASTSYTETGNVE